MSVISGLLLVVNAAGGLIGREGALEMACGRAAAVAWSGTAIGLVSGTAAVAR
jgi:hypothetical protein